MRSDVHFAALRAAAKVAFSVASVALVNGCSAADRSLTNGESTEESTTNESAISEGQAKEPCDDAGAAKPKPSCDAVLASAYPTPSQYQWEPVAQSAEVVACCDEELTKHGVGSTYRWDCCVAYDPNAVPDDAGSPSPWSSPHAMACTPWGPPVPPSMARRARLRAPREDVSTVMMAVA